MTYPEYYEADETEKENEVVMDDDFELSEHLRFSSHSFKSVDDEAAALKKYNEYLQSEDLNAKRSSGSRSHRGCRESGGSSDVNKKPPRQERVSSRSTSEHRRKYADTTTSKHDSRNGSTSKHDSRNSEISNVEACEKTVAIFGVTGVTGHYFLQLAIEAGYHVRALILPGFELEDMKDNPHLTLIQGTMDDQAKIHRVIRKAAYVVCMLNDCPHTLDTVPPTLVATHSNYDFIQKLVPLMSRCSNCKVLLYQVSGEGNRTIGLVHHS